MALRAVAMTWLPRDKMLCTNSAPRPEVLPVMSQVKGAILGGGGSGWRIFFGFFAVFRGVEK